MGRLQQTSNKIHSGGFLFDIKNSAIHCTLVPFSVMGCPPLPQTHCDSELETLVFKVDAPSWGVPSGAREGPRKVNFP